MRLLIRTALMVVAIVLGGGCGLLLSTNDVLVVGAQSPTPPPSIHGQGGSWPPNEDVTVNINPQEFQPWEIDCLKIAVANWNASNGSSGNDSGVLFRVTTSTEPVAVVNGSDQSVSTIGAQSMQVSRGTVPASGGNPAGTNPAMTYNPVPNDPSGHRTAAVVIFDERVTDCMTLTAFFADKAGL
jgi:hypothetical protein